MNKYQELFKMLYDFANLTADTEHTLTINTTYSTMVFNTRDIYTIACRNIDFNARKIIDEATLIVEPVVGNEIEIPIEHITDCFVK